MSAPEVTASVLQETAGKIGVRIPEEYEADYTDLLKIAKADMEAVMGMDGTSWVNEVGSSLIITPINY